MFHSFTSWFWNVFVLLFVFSGWSTDNGTRSEITETLKWGTGMNLTGVTKTNLWIKYFKLRSQISIKIREREHFTSQAIKMWKWTGLNNEADGTVCVHSLSHFIKIFLLLALHRGQKNVNMVVFFKSQNKLCTVCWTNTSVNWLKLGLFYLDCMFYLVCFTLT